MPPSPYSPAIKAASEKLAALKVDGEKQESKSPLKIGAASSETFPSASSEVLEAQRKRFEELKVRQYSYCCLARYALYVHMFIIVVNSPPYYLSTVCVSVLSMVYMQYNISVDCA